MSKLRVRCFSLSLDGFGAGPEQSLENPMGIGGLDLHQWVFPTATIQQTLFGKETGTTGIDNDLAPGGTTFHFVTEGIHAALERARAAAGGMDVRLGGGVASIQQYLRAGLIDELHLAVAPVLLGSGESLFSGINMRALGYECVEHVATDKATYVVLEKN
jgi:hypothetical protein